MLISKFNLKLKQSEALVLSTRRITLLLMTTLILRITPLLTSSLLLISASSGEAFPELVRYGYNTCMACHVSPTGGGMLTPYGRKLAAELFTTWGNEATTGVTWGLADQEQLENALWLGGDARGVQVHQENAAIKAGRFIKMQASLSAAWVRDAWTVFLEFGKQAGEVWQPYGTSFWAKFDANENMSLRAGRFVPAYGLHLSDHIAFIRSFTGFGLDAGRDAVEARYATENASVNVTASKEPRLTQPEQALSIFTELSLSEKHLIGANVLRGDREGNRRTLYGLWASIGLSKQAYYLGEFDWQARDGSTNTTSFITYHRLGYSLMKGLDIFALYERLESDLNVASSSIERRGPGVQWTPLPHIEVTGSWTKQRLHTPNPMEEDYAWLIFHYWL